MRVLARIWTRIRLIVWPPAPPTHPPIPYKPGTEKSLWPPDEEK